MCKVKNKLSRVTKISFFSYRVRSQMKKVSVFFLNSKHTNSICFGAILENLVQ